MKKFSIRAAIPSAVIFVLFLVCYVSKPYVFGNDFVGEVTDKQIKRYNGSDVYLIFVREDGQEKVHTFKNCDCWSRFKFNSSDYQANIHIGKRYRFTTLGVRISITSSYPNIVDYEEIKE